MNGILQKIGLILLVFTSFQMPNATCQITGGQHVFQFLSLPVSSRITAMGGAQIAVKDDDPVFAAANPAALNPMMDGHIAINHNFFLSDIQHGYVAYAQHLEKLGFTVQGGLQYIKYGDIDRADEFGNIQGKVKASETAFTLGGARALTGRISLGLNLRLAVSTLDVYQASALLADAGLMYADTIKRVTVGLVIRNAGAQMATYNETREPLPLDVQLGITKRLRHLPFRFGVVAHHLTDWDIRYNDPNAENEDVLLFGDEKPTENKGSAAIDNFFRHLIFNGEFLLGKNEGLRFRLGYNHLRKRELTVRNYRSLAGFSGGIGIKIKRFRVDFGYASYHLAGGVVHLGIGTNLKDFF
jgi:Uncharacterised protein family (UPF0164)